MQYFSKKSQENSAIILEVLLHFKRELADYKKEKQKERFLMKLLYLGIKNGSKKWM